MGIEVTRVIPAVRGGGGICFGGNTVEDMEGSETGDDTGGFGGCPWKGEGNETVEGVGGLPEV